MNHLIPYLFFFILHFLGCGPSSKIPTNKVPSPEEKAPVEKQEAAIQKSQPHKIQSLISMSDSQTSSVDSRAPCSKSGKCPDIQWIKLPAGSFDMGSWNHRDLEKPVRTVKVQEFVMAKSEVTVAQYRQCVEAQACSILSRNKGPNCNWDKPGRDNYPMNCISWGNARTFARWIGGELPTEAQWEYAARSSGQDVEYPWGHEEPTCDHTSFKCDRDKQNVSVCSKSKGNTKQGLCDMNGSLSEFVLDERVEEGYDGAPTVAEQPVGDVPECVRDAVECKSHGAPTYRMERIYPREVINGEVKAYTVIDRRELMRMLEVYGESRIRKMERGEDFLKGKKEKVQSGYKFLSSIIRGAEVRARHRQYFGVHVYGLGQVDPSIGFRPVKGEFLNQSKKAQQDLKSESTKSKLEVTQSQTTDQSTAYPTDYISGDGSLVLHMNIQRFKQSPIYKRISEGSKRSPILSQINNSMAMILKLAVDSVSLQVLIKKEYNGPKFITYLKAKNVNFDQWMTFTGQQMNNKITLENSRTIYYDKEGLGIEFLSNGVLIGDQRLIKAAKPGPMKGSLVAIKDQVKPNQNDLWGGIIIDSKIKGFIDYRYPMLAPFKRVVITLDFSKGLNLNLKASVVDKQKAAETVKVIQYNIDGAVQAMPFLNNFISMIPKIKVKAQEKDVTLSLTLDTTEVDRILTVLEKMN